MASCSTSQWTSSSPYVRATVTLDTSASDGDTAVLNWVLEYIASSAANTSVAKSYTFKMAGSVVKSGTYDIDGKTGTKTIASGTKTIAKTTSAQTISFSIEFGFNLTWTGVYSGTRTASGTISVPAKTSYTITYNANGGTGAPAAQTKWFGTAITLSSTKPSRTGHSFAGWGTSSTGSVVYKAGASYTANANITLYAIWTPNTYKVAFNANGGTGAPAAQTKTYGTTLTLSTTKPTRTNYTFKGWGTSANATSVAYAAGASYTANADATLYAIWTLSYTKPRITGYSIGRCDSGGSLSDNGTYALVKFNWATDTAVSKITIECIASDKTTTSTTVSASGTGGSVSSIVGKGALSPEATYTIRATVVDSGGSTSKSGTLPGLKFPIDVLAGGLGVSFGKPAELEGYADFGMGVHFDNNLTINGRDLEGRMKEAFQPVNQSGNTIVGWGNYNLKSGNTNVYGHDIHIGVSNIAEPGYYRPYRRQGDTLTFSLRTAGYVTNAGQDVTFVVPFAVPIVGNPTVTVASVNGFVLRQDNTYTHGSSSTTYVTPDSYSASVAMWCGVYITAKFSNVTNVTNNDSIGIYWNGTITFS